MVKVELSNEEIDMIIAAYEEKGIAACSLFLALDKEKQNIKDTIGLVFKDYLESLKIKNK